ncbi:MAG: carboxypeptidase regulatory-like domain-containing protein [Chloroflexi bacterium]|nr:carboxypeptidase regulatory-like domain-containing protein [Chloroflexota bacterium]
MAINLTGRVYDDQGSAVSGAAVRLFDASVDPFTDLSGTVADTTTNAYGKWSFTALTEGSGIYAVRITSGGQVQWVSGDGKVQYADINLASSLTLTSPTIASPAISGGTLHDAAVHIDGGSLVLPQGSGYAATAEGQIGWDSTSNRITVGSGSVTKRFEAIAAWGTVNGSTLAVLSGYGIASVSKASTGVYTVTWATAFASTAYGVLLTPVNTNERSAWLPATAKTTTGCQVQFKDGSGIDADVAQFSVLVLGV